MNNKWNQAVIQRYIDDKVEENAFLEYKEARALDQSPGKKKEIAKDVSAMANATGGIIIYGISEYQEKEKKHLPEKLDPINRTQFSKEWLDQVINSNIHPRIEGLRIHPPIELNTGSNHVVYVVEIPQSTTAHQVLTEQDYRYYERANFEVVRMPDYRIRDVMNRGIIPNIEVKFSAEENRGNRDLSKILNIEICNPGNQLVHHFKLDILFPNLEAIIFEWSMKPIGKVKLSVKPEFCSVIQRDKLYCITYRSNYVLFPQDTINISADINLEYTLEFVEPQDRVLQWTLYADKMLPKNGEIVIHKMPRER